MPTQSEPRRVARQGMPSDVQLGLLHGDVDAIIAKMDENEEKRKRDRAEDNQRIDRITWLLVTTFITLATTVVLFAVNLMTGAF